MMKNKLFIITLGLLIVAIIGGTLFMEKKEYSEIENRYLTDLSLDNLDDYLVDYFPFRTNLLSFKNKIDYLLGKRYINGVYLGKDNYLIPEYASCDKQKYIVEAINNYSQDKDVITMFIPDSIAVNEDKLPFNLGNNEEEDLLYFEENLDCDFINLLDDLREQNELSNDLYYLSDHHWTSRAAYLAYEKYCESLNLKINKNYEIKTVTDNFLGTSSSLVLGLGEKDKIDIYEYKNNLSVEYCDTGLITNSLYEYSHLNTKDKYSLFLDGNHSLIKITNKRLNSGSIVIIKNSYANCFIPFIVNNYQNVYVVDLRYYNDSVSKLVEDNQVESTLIMYNLNNLYSDLSIIKLK